MRNFGNQFEALLSQNPSRRDVLQFLGLAGATAAAPGLFSMEEV